MAHRLPAEVVTHIMRFLCVSDRKEASLVCRTWYEASLDPILQRDIVLHFQALETSNRLPSLTRRNMPHLVVDKFDNSINAKSVMLKSCEELSHSLQSLSLKASNITENTLVDLLSHCKNLLSLDLSCCNSLFKSGKLLESHTDVQKLQPKLGSVQNLNLSSIRFLSDVTFNRIVTVCPNVKSLSLASTQIIFSGNALLSSQTFNSSITFDNFLKYLKKHSTNIHTLNLSRTSISDEDIELLVSVEGLHLEEFILSSCKDLSDQGIADVCKYQIGLKTIDLKGCVDLTDGCISVISSNLLKLENLQVSKCRRITDSSVKNLKHLPNLHEVDLSENYQLTSHGLIAGLCGNINIPLTHLNLNCCPSVTDSFVVSLCKVVPHLQYLNMGSCFPVTDVSLIAISKSLKQLRYLRLAWCKEITDLGLLGYEATATTGSRDKLIEHRQNSNGRGIRKYNSTQVIRKSNSEDKDPSLSTTELDVLLSGSNSSCRLKNLSLLRDLDLSACSKLTDTGLTQVLHFKELRSLFLNMLQITDMTVMSLTASNPSIEQLGLAQCSAITDDAVEVIVKRLSRLTTLNISSCDKLTNNSIHLIKQHCRRLRNLDVSFCQNISLYAVEALENSMNLLSIQKRLLGGV